LHSRELKAGEKRRKEGRKEGRRMFGSSLTRLDEVSYPNFRIAQTSFSSRVLDWVIGFCKDRFKNTLQHCVCIHNNMLHYTYVQLFLLFLRGKKRVQLINQRTI
jgi:hypothetical protein